MYDHSNQHILMSKSRTNSIVISCLLNYFNNILYAPLASPYGKTKRVRWTEDEKKTALSAFAQHMENYTLPSLKEIQEVKKKYISLARRTSPQIKTWLHNKLKTLRQQ